MKDSQIRKHRISGLFFIAISTLVSFILATSTDMSNLELGALVNYLWPPIIGLFCFITFLVISFLVKRKVLLTIVLGLFCLYILYVGFALFINKDNWPLVTF